MRNILLAAFATALLAAPAVSQDADSLQSKYEAKVAAEWVSHGGWILDLDEALAQAKRENKRVFAYFTRSYSP